MLDSYKALKLERRGGILVITMDNPPVNAMTEAMHGELTRIFHDINHDPETKVVVLTGGGEKAFSAGGNVNNMIRRVQNKELQSMADGLNEAKAILRGFLNLKKPIIGRINGHAMGLGATLAVWCDVTFMVKHGKIGDTHVKMGLAAGDGGAALWPLLVGISRAKELLMTGEVMNGERAAKIGLITHAVEAADLDARVYGLAEQLASGASIAINATKTAVNLLLRHQLDALLDAHTGLEFESFGSEDHREAVFAFREKRTPKFTGR